MYRVRDRRRRDAGLRRIVQTFDETAAAPLCSESFLGDTSTPWPLTSGASSRPPRRIDAQGSSVLWVVSEETRGVTCLSTCVEVNQRVRLSRYIAWTFASLYVIEPTRVTGTMLHRCVYSCSALYSGLHRLGCRVGQQGSITQQQQQQQKYTTTKIQHRHQQRLGDVHRSVFRGVCREQVVRRLFGLVARGLARGGPQVVPTYVAVYVRERLLFETQCFAHPLR